MIMIFQQHIIQMVAYLGASIPVSLLVVIIVSIPISNLVVFSERKLLEFGPRMPAKLTSILLMYPILGVWLPQEMTLVPSNCLNRFQ